VDPPIAMQVFILPVIMCLIAGPLCNLVLMASYYQGWIIIFISLIMLLNFFILYLRFRKKLLNRVDEIFGHEKKKEYPDMIKEKIELGKQQTEVKVLTAIFTAWVSPCSVMSYNNMYQSRFLIASSSTSFIVHIIGICSVALFAQFSDLSKMSNPPIFHCFTLDQHNYTEK